MAYKPPVPDNPYLPTGGYNPDANGLSLRLDECADISNFRIFQKELVTREGHRRLGFAPVTDSSDSPVHFHTYKAPGGDEILFCFTSTGIYRYNNGGFWENAIEFSKLDAIDSTTDFSSDSLGLNNFSPGYSDNACVLGLNLFGNFTNGDKFLGKTYAVGLDASNETHIRIYYVSGSAIDLTLEFYTDAAFTTLVTGGSFSVTLEETSEWTYVEVAMPVPANFNAIRSWAFLVDGNQSLGSYSVQVDYLISTTVISTAIEHWHTTDFVDNSEGATVIAAGSNPPKPNDEEDDQAARVLYYYDTTNEYFAELTTKENLPVSEEFIVAGAASTTHTGSLAKKSGTETIKAGTLVLYTAELGTFATASVVLDGGSSSYHLQPVGETVYFTEGATSYVQADGDYSIAQNAETGLDGLRIYADYTWNEVVVYKPRFVWEFHNRLLFGNTYEDSLYQTWRIRWSLVGDITTFNAVDYQDLIDTDITPIVGGDFQGYYLNIYKSGSIVKGSYVGGASTFLFNTVWKSGTFAGRTLQTFQHRQYFLGEDDVYVFDGAQVVSLTYDFSKNQDRVQEKILNSINTERINFCFGGINAKRREYWLFIADADTDYPTKAFVYSILRKIWFVYEFNQVTCIGNYHIEQESTIDSLVGTIDEQNWAFEGGSLEGITPALILGMQDGTAQQIDENISSDGGYFDPDSVWIPGADISSYVITRDFVFGDLPRQDRTQRLNFEAYGSSVDLSYSNEYTVQISSFRNTESIALTPEIKERHYFLDAVGEHIRFLFESSTYTRLRWIQPFAIRTKLHNE